MNAIVLHSPEAVAEAVAQEWVDVLVAKPHAVICMASGNSPKLACSAFVRLAAEQKVDVSEFFFVGLDEWVGVDPGARGSCRSDFQERIFGPLDVPADRYHLFNGMAVDLEEECRLMDAIIAEKGGIDLMIVGIGMNGHIGFNEPGTSFGLLCHVRRLDESTSQVGQQYFDQAMTLEHGITLGPAHILASRRLLLVAQGAAKADVIRRALEGPIGPAFPASMIQSHADAAVIVDGLAGQLLRKDDSEHRVGE